MIRSRLVLCLATASLAVAVRADQALGPPPGQAILYIGDDCRFGDDVVVAGLRCLGHAVTEVCVRDAGFADEVALAGLLLEDFDEVWDNRFSGRSAAPSSDTITPEDVALLDAYLRQGGSVYLAGENEGFRSRNDGLFAFLTDLISTSGPVGPAGVDCSDDHSPVLNPDAAVLDGAQAFGSDPIVVGDHSMAIHCPGSLSISAGAIGSGRPVLVHGAGSALAPLHDHAIALAFTGCGDIQPERSAGKVFVFMDAIVTSWQGLGTRNCPPSDAALFALLDNIADFLVQDPFLVAPDSDGDFVKDSCDNCPLVANGASEDAQADGDGDGLGDACDACPGADDRQDRDGDRVPDACDNCPFVANGPAEDAQADADLDGAGDACDACPTGDDRLDEDADGRPDGCDACPRDPFDDADEDGVCGDVDNCNTEPNPRQEDGDSNGVGDACECGIVHQVPPDFGPGASLRVSAGARLTWDAVTDASHYPVYRGSIPHVGGLGARPGAYDHACLDHPVRTSADDASSPPTGCWYYLVNAANSCGQAPDFVGTDSLGRGRPAPPCP